MSPVVVPLIAADGTRSTITLPDPPVATPARSWTVDVPNGLALSSFAPQAASSSDDDLIAAAFAYCAAQTYHGQVIVLDQPRTYSFTRQQPGYNGLCVTGAGRPVDQGRGSMPISQKVNLNIAGGTGRGGWLVPQGSTMWGWAIEAISFDGNSTSRVIDPTAGCVLWTSVFRDCSMQNIASFLGSSGQYQQWDACVLDGWWNLNNIRDTAWNVGGSDCQIAPSLLLMDSPEALLGQTQFITRFTSQSKTSAEHLYLTADQHSGILATGNSDELEISQSRIEGRNANTPCYGALIRVQQSDVAISHSWVSYGMSNPGATGRDDAGLIHACQGATVLIDSVTTRQAAGVTAPFLYVDATSSAVVRNIRPRGYPTGSKPVVKVAAGGVVDADDTVTVTS